MTREERIASLLDGAVDLHIHTDPSFMKRSVDIMEAAEECCYSGMRAIASKDHHAATGVGAYIVTKYMHRYNNRPFDVFGSICLNNAVGFNPKAVNAALKLGTKIVYMPTIAARAHLIHLAKENKGDGNAHFIPQKIKAKQEEELYVIDGNSELKPEIAEILDIIKENDAVLATGHCDYDETFALVKYAKKIGLERVTLTHLPHFTTMDFTKLDVIVDTCGLVEANLCLMADMTPDDVRMTEDEFCDFIRYFGPERCTMCSDAGSVAVKRPVAYFTSGIELLIDHGFTDEEIRAMVKTNPAKLIGIED